MFDVMPKAGANFYSSSSEESDSHVKLFKNHILSTE